MKDGRIPEGSIVMGKIELVSFIPPDGGNTLLYWETSDGNTGEIDIMTQLGMLELAKGYVIEDNRYREVTKDEPDA